MKIFLIIITVICTLSLKAQVINTMVKIYANSSRAKVNRMENERQAAFKNFAESYNRAETIEKIEGNTTYYYKGRLLVGFKYENRQITTNNQVNVILETFRENLRIKWKVYNLDSGIQYYAKKDDIIYSITVEAYSENQVIINQLFKTANIL
ncbi:hypothetical protein [Gaoshiqia sediminis]|uniref:Uncharacterized protein n=1 Tax=Gaoshiqia sediminis TaxID=2986998 RepID=A0AA41YDC0_9BACT|nr:hypothetical protein [Gaoshiqia sediminis]MCW0484673.1 hypothetical protein [Gaoshiqia sediminis]